MKNILDAIKRKLRGKEDPRLHYYATGSYGKAIGPKPKPDFVSKENLDYGARMKKAYGKAKEEGTLGRGFGP